MTKYEFNANGYQGEAEIDISDGHVSGFIRLQDGQKTIRDGIVKRKWSTDGGWTCMEIYFKRKSSTYVGWTSGKYHTDPPESSLIAGYFTHPNGHIFPWVAQK